MGRPTKYKPEYCEQAYKLCLLGATDKEMAGFFGVEEKTINNWKHEYPEFLQSLKEGKIKADADVANSLYHRALGYEHDDIHFSAYEGKVTQTEYTKHYPPDTAAAFIWLKNRAGWKDKHETDISLSKETAQLLGIIDGGTKGRLPDKAEGEDVG